MLTRPKLMEPVQIERAIAFILRSRLPPADGYPNAEVGTQSHDSRHAHGTTHHAGEEVERSARQEEAVDLSAQARLRTDAGTVGRAREVAYGARSPPLRDPAAPRSPPALRLPARDRRCARQLGGSQ